jgi:hypothetical protein
MENNGYLNEQNIKKYLIENDIAFEQHKKILGEGNKYWIVDFYLKDQGIIIEAKSCIKDRIRNNHHELHPHKEMMLYKDLFKLEELHNRYGLTPVLIVEYPTEFSFSPSFISNISAHSIYFITNTTQILPIIQAKHFQSQHQKLAHIQEINKETDTKQKEEAKKLNAPSEESDHQIVVSSTMSKIAMLYATGKPLADIARIMGKETNTFWHITTVKRELQKYLRQYLTVSEDISVNQKKLL